MLWGVFRLGSEMDLDVVWGLVWQSGGVSLSLFPVTVTLMAMAS